MQSIYRFREAEVGLFLRVRREGMGALGLEPITLTVNFRSSAPLVDWVNGAFDAILPEEEDVQTGAVPFSRAEAHEGSAHDGSGGDMPGGEPAVEVIPLLAEGEDGRPQAEAAEADAVADRIASALENRPEETVAVLVRARTHLAEILPVLHRRGIPFRAVEIERLEGRPVIQDLLSLTRALLHPGDRVAWLSVLRAPWCGLTLADLLGLAGDAPGQPIWEAIADVTRTAALSADGRERLQRVAEVLGPSLAQRRRLPLRRWVEGAWLALGGPACVLREDLPNANTYFDLLERLEGQRQPLDPTVLAEKLQGLFAAPRTGTGTGGTDTGTGTDTGAGVEVMSIHKAKGLEFDTVILPGLGRPPRHEDPPLLRWVERSNPALEGGGLVMAPLHETGGETDPIYGFLARIERERERHETGRLLYVAATRAKSRLILLGHARVAEDGPGMPHVHSLLRRLWVTVNDRFTEEWEHFQDAAGQVAGESAPQHTGREARSAQPARPAQVQVIRRLVSGWSLPEPPPALPGWKATWDDEQPGQEIEFSWAGETARLVGTLTHRLLNRIAFQGPAVWPMGEGDLQTERVRRALAGLGVPRENLGEAADKVLRAVKGTFAHEKGRWLMQPHVGARSEYSVTSLREGVPVHAVIDRTFVDEEGVRWIVDFKTGSHAGSDRELFLDREQERYRGQLEGYAEIMARLDPGKPIKLGLYFPLLGEWREWEAEIPEVPESPQGALADDLPKETP
jgi:ATP-dependent exoDNAse (exonuclease V) beta subunit